MLLILALICSAHCSAADYYSGADPACPPLCESSAGPWVLSLDPSVPGADAGDFASQRDCYVALALRAARDPGGSRSLTCLLLGGASR